MVREGVKRRLSCARHFPLKKKHFLQLIRGQIEGKWEVAHMADRWAISHFDAVFDYTTQLKDSEVHQAGSQLEFRLCLFIILNKTFEKRKERVNRAEWIDGRRGTCVMDLFCCDSAQEFLMDCGWCGRERFSLESRVRMHAIANALSMDDGPKKEAFNGLRHPQPVYKHQLQSVKLKPSS